MRLLTFISVLFLSTCSKSVTVKLDGSKSIGSIVSWHWHLISGPGTVTFDRIDSSVVNVSGTSIATGVYIIGLDVIDQNGNKSTGTATVTVTK